MSKRNMYISRKPFLQSFISSEVHSTVSKMIRIAILSQFIILGFCQIKSSLSDESIPKTKDMKFKLLSGDLIPLVGCKR